MKGGNNQTKLWEKWIVTMSIQCFLSFNTI